MAALPATTTGSSGVTPPATLEGPPLTTGTFYAIFNGYLHGEINNAYNRELAQRGLTHLQIPGGEDLQQLKMDQTTAIVRPDLYMRAHQCVYSRLRVEAAPLPLKLTTKNYFYVLHDLNCAHSDNIRGKVNARYNQRILHNLLRTRPIPGENLEELGMNGERKYPILLNSHWYIKAFEDVVGKQDRFLRCPGLSAEESIMDRLGGMDPIRVMLSHLPVRDLAVSKGVCRAWAAEVRGLQQLDASRPISGPIEAQFPSHQVFGPQFWAELQTRSSQHPDSAGHPRETIGEFLIRRREALLTRADALIEANPVEAERLRRIAEGYMLDCEATWTRADVVSLYQMMGSVAREVEGSLGCAIVLKPKDYHLDIHRDIVIAAARSIYYGSAQATAGFRPPFQLGELAGALPSGPVTLSALSNAILVGSQNTSIDEQDARARALGCEAPELLDLLILIHFTCLTKHVDLYSRDWSNVQECSADGRRYKIGMFSCKHGLRIFPIHNPHKDRHFGTGVQRKVTAVEQARK